MSGASPVSTAFLGSYAPRKCGIATFTFDLVTGLATHVHGRLLAEDRAISIVAMNDRSEGYEYGPEVRWTVEQRSELAYRETADALNNSNVNVLCLQHEYGLFGGESGEYLLHLINRLRKPLVTTLHTVLEAPNDTQRKVMSRICQRSSKLVVMAERARGILQRVHEVPADKIRLIHHGVPDVPFADTTPFKKRFGLGDRPMMLTFGLLGPSKSMEVMIEAMAKVVPDHPDLVYIILGVTHPGVKAESGESYRLGLERKAAALGLKDNVRFHNRYVDIDDLCEYLQAADVYTTPYRNREQITSGTLAYALATGRAIISTPYWYAEELLADGRGCLVGFDDVNGFAAALKGLLDDPARREAMRHAAYEYGRKMTWQTVARQYEETFAEVAESFESQSEALAVGPATAVRLSLPELRLDHLYRLSDDTGILQHAIFATPDRAHGYCSDDNSRALIIAAKAYGFFRDETILPYLHRYLAFLHFAQPEQPDELFRNFMSYDRRWIDKKPSNDCHGRVIWSLGHLMAYPPDPATGQLARRIFDRAAHGIEHLVEARGTAFCIFGYDYFIRSHPQEGGARDKLAWLADRLTELFDAFATDDWPWFEDVVTYDNGRLPQAMITAGRALDRPQMVDRGLHLLQWLLKIQTSELGNLSVIGNRGWYRRGEQKARFDQQPLEATALLDACLSAYRATGDGHWLAEMERCFEWFLGHNDSGLSLVDFRSRGCYDGLGDGYVNQNQGAESHLAWLYALIRMYEMRNADLI